MLLAEWDNVKILQQLLKKCSINRFIVSRTVASKIFVENNMNNILTLTTLFDRTSNSFQSMFSANNNIIFLQETLFYFESKQIFIPNIIHRFIWTSFKTYFKKLIYMYSHDCYQIYIIFQRNRVKINICKPLNSYQL